MFNFFKNRRNNDVATNSIVNEHTSYFQKLHANSMELLNAMVEGNNAYGSQEEVTLIENCIGFMKEAIEIFRDRSEIINQILKIDFICPLIIAERGLYGKMDEYYQGRYGIYLNPSLSGNNILTSYERTRLYFYHELGHTIHRMWIDQALAEMQNLVRRNILNNDEAVKFYEGFCMLDEASTQEWAEEVAYTMAGKNRPASRAISFGNYQMPTNFDFYGELQTLSGGFAKTLRGIGKYDSNQYALNLLSKRALSSNFVQDIIFEYKKDGHFDDLINLLILMGMLKEASYARFGMGKVDFDINNVIRLTAEFCNNLRDYRERNF